MKAMLRQEFKDLPKKINWFPGHMRKALNEVQDELQKANLFIEVRDARIPVTSYNKELIELIKEKQPKLKCIRGSCVPDHHRDPQHHEPQGVKHSRHAPRIEGAPIEDIALKAEEVQSIHAAREGIERQRIEGELEGRVVLVHFIVSKDHISRTEE